MALCIQSRPEFVPARSLVIVAGGGLDLAWPHLLGWSSLVMPAQWQLHGRAAGPIRNRELLELAVARAEAHTSPGVSTSVLVVAFPGGSGTASLVSEARRLASRSPVPIAVVEVSPSAGRWAKPTAVSCP